MTETAHNQTETRDHVAIPQAGLLGRLIDKGALVFAAGIVLAMLILINEVFLRYVLNAPTIWAHETTIFLCGIAFLYGGLLCTARDRHIRVVLLYDFIPKGLRRYLDVVISVICAAASLMFAWAAWLMVSRAVFRPDGTIRLERSGSAWDPAFPGLMKIFLLIIMSVMALQFAILAVNYLRGRR